ncbi:MAG: ATP-grasp domain-containing protein, partial [Spirochaetota bacterium]
MPERILIIGAGVLQVPAIEIAQEMGLFTIVSDYNSSAPGMKIADHPLIVSTRDVDGNVRLARDLNKKMKIHGVITVGTDASMTVSAVANALGLPGIKFEDASAATNKIKMRERFAKHAVPQPDFFPSWTYAEALAAFRKLTKPVVVKPADNMGSRGVMKVDKEADMLFAFQRAKSASPSGEVIVEEYMDGPELSIDMLIHEGTIHVTGIADRIVEYPPYFVETGHILPSALPEEQVGACIDVMKKGIAALNLTMGAAKGDIKFTSSGAKVGEIAARLSGGFMSAYTYPLATGVNLIKNALEISLGRAPSDLTPKFSRVSMEKALIPGSGIVQEVEGVDRV